MKIYRNTFFVQNHFLIIKKQKKIKIFFKMANGSHLENRMILGVLGIFQRYRVILEFFPSFFMIKNWFRTKKHSCKFSKKSIVKKLQIGSNIIFLMGMKIIHICNFLTMKFYEKLQEYFFVQNQFVIIKKRKKYLHFLNFLWLQTDFEQKSILVIFHQIS